MTKSELIAKLAAHFPQLVASDAELAVKMILDAMAKSLAQGHRIEIRGFGSFGLNYRPPTSVAIRNPVIRYTCRRNTCRISRRARSCASAWTSRASRRRRQCFSSEQYGRHIARSCRLFLPVFPRRYCAADDDADALPVLDFADLVVCSLARLCTQKFGSGNRTILSWGALGGAVGAGGAGLLCNWRRSGRCSVLRIRLPAAARNPAIAQGIAGQTGPARICSMIRW